MHNSKILLQDFLVNGNDYKPFSNFDLSYHKKSNRLSTNETNTTLQKTVTSKFSSNSKQQSFIPYQTERDIKGRLLKTQVATPIDKNINFEQEPNNRPLTIQDLNCNEQLEDRSMKRFPKSTDLLKRHLNQMFTQDVSSKMKQSFQSTLLPNIKKQSIIPKCFKYKELTLNETENNMSSKLINNTQHHFQVYEDYKSTPQNIDDPKNIYTFQTSLDTKVTTATCKEKISHFFNDDFNQNNNNSIDQIKEIYQSNKSINHNQILDQGSDEFFQLTTQKQQNRNKCQQINQEKRHFKLNKQRIDIIYDQVSQNNFQNILRQNSCKIVDNALYKQQPPAVGSYNPNYQFLNKSQKSCIISQNKSIRQLFKINDYQTRQNTCDDNQILKDQNLNQQQGASQIRYNTISTAKQNQSLQNQQRKEDEQKFEKQFSKMMQTIKKQVNSEIVQSQGALLHPAKHLSYKLCVNEDGSNFYKDGDKIKKQLKIFRESMSKSKVNINYMAHHMMDEED